MKCPHCGELINDRELAHYLAAKGGRKGKRRLDPKEARRMQRLSAQAKRAKKTKQQRED
jgi:hypothetical protein